MKQNSKKKGTIGIVIMAVLLVLVIVMDSLCYVYSNMINLFFRETAETDIEAVELSAQQVTTDINAEGTVLLKNDGDLLPISGNVNLFGACSYQQLYLGTGSAGGWNWDSDSCVNLKDALASEGITVNPDLWQFYIDNFTENSGQEGGVTNMTGASHNIVEQPLSRYGDALLEGCKSYSDTAILVFGRAGGEGSDAIMDMSEASGGDAGKSYLELQDVELELVNYVKENFSNVIVLINTPMAIECGWIDDTADTGANTPGDIDAALWIGLPGLSGNYGVAQVISGKVSPSGRLADTWAYEVESAPSYYNFGDFTYTNGGDSQYTSKYVHYMEGIYVGYRWYETASAMGASVTGVTNYNGESKDFDFGNYGQIVQYPFGYGLSYTTFSQEWDGDPAYDAAPGQLTFKVKVSNTGSVASKTVVELYCEQPYTSGGVEKSKVILAGYVKTPEIAAGASETVAITVNQDELASYDYQNERCYVLDAGDYVFYSELGTNGSHCWAVNDGSVLSHTVTLGQQIYNASNPRPTDETAAVNQFDDISAGDGAYSTGDYLTRADFAATFPKAYADRTATAASDVMARMTDQTMGASVPEDSTALSMPATGDKSRDVYCEDLVGKSYDDPLWDGLLNRLTVDELTVLTGACGWQNPAIASIKKKACIDMDGAEGLHDLVNGVSLNMYNSSVVTASTWNTDLAYQMGSIYGDECISQNVTGMYGFSMNTHRSPFGGRNFEYYSEDPFISGKTCAAEVAGIQSKGVYVYMKHFALNDQETARDGISVWTNEQAAREIYLQAFEYPVVESGAYSVMTSFNRMGCTWAGGDKGLLTGILRGEWGMPGFALTDFSNSNNYMDVVNGVMAGGDAWDCNDSTKWTSKLMEYKDDPAVVTAMKAATKHILYTVANSNAMNGVSANMQVIEIRPWWKNALVAADVAFGVLAAGSIFMLVKTVKKSKKDTMTTES